MVKYAANPVTNAILANLTAATLVVGDGEKPDAGGWSGPPDTSAFVGYVVVHAISRQFDGSIDDPFDDGAPVVQFSSYGTTRAQAQLIGDMAAAALQNTPLTITGRHVMLIEPTDEGATMRFDDEQPPIWQDAQRFRIHTTAA